MKKHTTTRWGEYAADTFVGNGFIGFRFAKNPFKEVVGCNLGFTTLRDNKIGNYIPTIGYCMVDDGTQCLAAMPAPGFIFAINGYRATEEIVSQTYDFSNGEFTTEAILSVEHKKWKVQVQYMVYCPRTAPTLLMSNLTFKGDPSLKLQFDLYYNVRPYHQHTLGKHEEFEQRRLQYSCDNSSAIGISCQVFGEKQKTTMNGIAAHTEVELTPEGTEVCVVSSYVPSNMHSEPHNEAFRMIRYAPWHGLDVFREDNRRAWAKLWESRITIEGAGEEWQNVVDASYFYLMSGISEFSTRSTSPYGVSDPDGYGGHVFWDTESFIFMTPLFCAPHTAEAMLNYRFERIPAAANNARLFGYRGILYPWQSGVTGDEVTGPRGNGHAAQHINLDIALAFDGYVRVTGDEDFAKERAWPIMKGVAQWAESRVVKTERGYEILHITGISEGHDNVNNDSFTNLMAARILRTAAEYSERFGHGKREKWLEIAEKMYIPVWDNGVMLQFEGMPEGRAYPTNMMVYFPYGYEDENMKTTLRYYIEHGMYDYCALPMLSGFMGVYPAWTGDRENAKKYYDVANLKFYTEPFYASTERIIDDPVNLDFPVSTCFLSARGSLLSGLIMGLTKMCPWKGDWDGPIDEWFGNDIVLPEGWTKLVIGKVYIRGKAYRITAEHGAPKAVLEELDVD